MATDLPAPALCNVGRAQEVITPPVGASLAGYFHDRKGESVRDDLFARAVVIESAGTRVGIVSCDLISMTAHGLSGVSRWVYGNVAGKVLQGAHCPILLVRPPAE